MYRLESWRVKSLVTFWAGPLMAAIRERLPDVRFVGIGGVRMKSQGLEALFELGELSIHGFLDPLKRLPVLLKIMRRLRRRFESFDAVIGIDFVEFNLILERSMKKRKVPTIQYVSPSVYAWRPRRVRRVAKSADLVLALFPFEPPFYKNTVADAVFVGHPFADEIEPVTDHAVVRDSSREKFGIGTGGIVIALLPGSRKSEVERMAGLFLQTAQCFCRRYNHERVVFLVPCVNYVIEQLVSDKCRSFSDLDIRVLKGSARDVLAACDVALIKSGTATLEGMLMGVPMVVAYQVGVFTYQIISRLVTSAYVSLPNILAERELVPEFIQDKASPAALASALKNELSNVHPESEYRRECNRLHNLLRQNASIRAAESVVDIINSKPTSVSARNP